MKAKPRAIVILSILFGYVLLQFLWWEILLVQQNGKIINEKQKVLELTFTSEPQLRKDIEALHHRKKMQTVMIVSEGTVFLLLLLFGIYKIKQSYDKENLLTQQQNNFFLSITHELKTPIAATKLQLQTLQKQKLDEVTQKELISNALLETERLNMLIDNVLLASRLDTGEFIFKKEKHNLSELVTTVVNRYYKNEISSSELKLNIPEDLYAEIDPGAFPSVITNLVDNAIKYSGPDRKIEVQMQQRNKQVILTISDNGFGISNKDKSRVFLKFYRAGSEETRQSKGTGLGLYIVNYIVKKHNATISVRDNQPKGSIFEVIIHAA